MKLTTLPKESKESLEEKEIKKKELRRIKEVYDSIEHEDCRVDYGEEKGVLYPVITYTPASKDAFLKEKYRELADCLEMDIDFVQQTFIELYVLNYIHSSPLHVHQEHFKQFLLTDTQLEKLFAKPNVFFSDTKCIKELHKYFKAVKDIAQKHDISTDSLVGSLRYGIVQLLNYSHVSDVPLHRFLKSKIASFEEKAYVLRYRTSLKKSVRPFSEVQKHTKRERYIAENCHNVQKLFTNPRLACSNEVYTLESLYPSKHTVTIRYSMEHVMAVSKFEIHDISIEGIDCDDQKIQIADAVVGMMTKCIANTDDKYERVCSLYLDSKSDSLLIQKVVTTLAHKYEHTQDQDTYQFQIMQKGEELDLYYEEISGLRWKETLSFDVTDGALESSGGLDVRLTLRNIGKEFYDQEKKRDMYEQMAAGTDIGLQFIVEASGEKVCEVVRIQDIIHIVREKIDIHSAEALREREILRTKYRKRLKRLFKGDIATMLVYIIGQYAQSRGVKKLRIIDGDQNNWLSWYAGEEKAKDKYIHLAQGMKFENSEHGYELKLDHTYWEKFLELCSTGVISFGEFTHLLQQMASISNGKEYPLALKDIGEAYSKREVGRIIGTFRSSLSKLTF